MAAENQTSRRIVILGGGFGGAYCAQALERQLRGLDDVEVLLLDRHNYFLFYPLLAEAGTGSLQPRHAVVSIRRFLRTARFRMAEAEGLDTRRRQITYRLTGSDVVRTTRYDHLVIALGSVTRMPPVPGLHEHGFDIKSMADAIGLRDRAIQMLEIADAIDDPQRRRALLHFVVVGANFTGTEVAGEFHAFLRKASRMYPHVRPDDCRVTLVELADRILPALDRDLSDFAEQHLRIRGIDVRLRTSVREVHANRVVLSTGEALAAHTTIWAAGIQANPLVAQLGLPVDERGYIVCRRDLRVQGFDNIWAIGDCAVNLDAEGKPYPATAQHAVQQGRHAAANIARALRGQPTQPCDIRSKGSLAALGCRTGVAKVFGIRLSGFIAWFLWRTVYLLKMPGLGRKARIALDWTVELFFDREYVQLGVHRPGGRQPAQAAQPPEQVVETSL